MATKTSNGKPALLTPTTQHQPDGQPPSAPVLGEYKGHTLLVLNPDSKYPFQFGVAKARLILERLEYIREFVATCGNDGA